MNLAPEPDLNAKAVQELAQQIADATQAGDIVALCAAMVTRTGEVKMPYSFIVGSHVLLLGGLEIVKTQIIQSAATAQMAANTNDRRPAICPKESLIGGCDWPRCDCAERSLN